MLTARSSGPSPSKKQDPEFHLADLAIPLPERNSVAACFGLAKSSDTSRAAPTLSTSLGCTSSMIPSIRALLGKIENLPMTHSTLIYFGADLISHGEPGAAQAFGKARHVRISLLAIATLCQRPSSCISVR